MLNLDDNAIHINQFHHDTFTFLILRILVGSIHQKGGQVFGKSYLNKLGPLLIKY